MGEKDVSISESSLTAKIKRLIFIQIFHPNDFNTVYKTDHPLTNGKDIY